MCRILWIPRRCCLHVTILQQFTLFWQRSYSLTRFRKPQHTSREHLNLPCVLEVTVLRPRNEKRFASCSSTERRCSTALPQERNQVFVTHISESFRQISTRGRVLPTSQNFQSTSSSTLGAARPSWIYYIHSFNDKWTISVLMSDLRLSQRWIPELSSSMLCILIYVNISEELVAIVFRVESIYLSVYLSMYPSICTSMALQPFVGPWPHFQLLNPIHSRQDSLTCYEPVARTLPIHRTTRTQNKRRKTSLPRVGLEPTTPVFERAKTIHALDLAARNILKQARSALKM
jgi:hypothetical protein